MSVFFHRYVLQSRGGLNAVSVRREFHGALIRVNEGIGCLHPWPEFGDEEVDVQLDILRDGGSSKVIERALRMAKVDGDARRAGVSLFSGLEVPLCHYSWDHHQSMESQIQRVKEEGWKAVKTKGWKETNKVLTWLQQFTESTSQITVRMDFNSCLQESAFSELLEAIPQETKERIDFFEDPFPYEASGWNAIRQSKGIRLALDKQLRGAVDGFDVAVLKPGRRDWREMVTELPRNTELVLTSAMDHAIGQSFAAWEAACAKQERGDQLSLCGLSTEHLFTKDAFFERLNSYGGKLAVDSLGTTGLGFDEVLKKLPWKRLV